MKNHSALARIPSLAWTFIIARTDGMYFLSCAEITVVTPMDVKSITAKVPRNPITVPEASERSMPIADRISEMAIA